MKLTFVAKEDLLCPMSWIRPRVGSPPRYIGRTFVPGRAPNPRNPEDAGVPAQHPATEEGFSVELGSKAGQICARACRQGDIWPKDAETAKFCGVEMPGLKFEGGAWTDPAAAEAKAKRQAEALARRKGGGAKRTGAQRGRGEQ